MQDLIGNYWDLMYQRMKKKLNTLHGKLKTIVLVIQDKNVQLNQ